MPAIIMKGIIHLKQKSWSKEKAHRDLNKVSVCFLFLLILYSALYIRYYCLIYFYCSLFILCNQRTNQESSAARRIFCCVTIVTCCATISIATAKIEIHFVQTRFLQLLSRFTSFRHDFCSCFLVNVAKIRCRVLASVVLNYFLPKDRRTSHDSRLLQSTVTL